MERLSEEKIHPEYQYLNLLEHILTTGKDKVSLGGKTELRCVFGAQNYWDLSELFPILTTKKVAYQTAFREMLWFISGSSNIKPLVDQNIHIWDEWAYRSYCLAAEKGEVVKLSQEEFAQKIKEEDKESEFVAKWGELGPVYGRQWRHWVASDGREIDQLAWVIDKMKRTPTRKHACVSAWNPEFIYEMAASGEKMMDLPPCHAFWQLDAEEGELSLHLFQRSCDMFLGVPFNIAQYSLLTRMLAQVTNLRPGQFVHTLSNAHVYFKHFEVVNEQIKREPRPLPTLTLNPNITDIDRFTMEDIKIEGYNPHPPLKGEIVVVGGLF